mmetsp:Transcript_4408/g.12711  ORF Transcript_4408/g.12711 Transcript_4408/m.12711 type:complete len:900 (-) Transcript_4408:172-2871(-)|eukprot:CAMPEP_0206149554 /NCGR_PEP_ID=MMETSP1473-20131121/37842_1 /ASSEMBLY_ACC=CAM_ASM_001109 /TAXON_ID=1461547 /ORGANISM="Stichococcus sp, Strain RCC1054" /LENGTH=899 /DNA_ID=CAMNT_0053547029 /DNA_START=108 /DNA_END=2807 /DNA_ORIENTATION=+
MEAYLPSSDDEGEDEGALSCALHDAAEAGDLEVLGRLLHVLTAPLEDLDPQLVALRSGPSALNIDDRDSDRCTPLHLAIINGHLECMVALLQAGASSTIAVEGSPALHAAVVMGGLPAHRSFCLEAVPKLLTFGADPCLRDDNGRLALHWAAELGLMEVVEQLLPAYRSQTAVILERAAGRASALTAAGDADAAAALLKEAQLPPAVEVQDKQGCTPLHAAAAGGHWATLELLLKRAEHPDRAVQLASRVGQLPLHSAAQAGSLNCAALLCHAAPGSKSVRDRRDHTPADLARRRGHKELAFHLSTDSEEPPLTWREQPASAGQERQSAAQRTVILAPSACLQHLTAPEPYSRSAPELPPENVARLHVLTHPERGALRAAEFASVSWDTSDLPAKIADVLRVHDWPYLRLLQAKAAALPEAGPGSIGHLDGDTAISRGTFAAALAAAGSVCQAVDAVVTKQASNVFCAIRPPGHHAGPAGVVTCENDPHGSHGFCLLNNIAIGAAYAVNVYRHRGVRRVAILDFDVHHGNGTEACVEAVAPSVARHTFKTPWSEGVQAFPVWRPWLDADDAEHVLFASVQGYGPKHPSMPGSWVYPASGATVDSRPPQHPSDPQAADTDSGATAAVKEDPDMEFSQPPGPDVTPGGPRIINVGVPGPGGNVPLWRRSWRDKILPAVVRFKPDIIFISAGFDAHKKDDINFRYIGIAEKEYEWLTDQIVQVANLCCQGRVVSALEGGYRIQGGPVSAFSRSVAAHVRALARPHTQTWSPADAECERTKEKERAAAVAARQAALEAKQAAATAAAAAAEAAAAASTAATAAAAAAESAPDGAAPVPGDAAAEEQATPVAAGDSGEAAAAPASLEAAADPESEPPSSKRRRRGGVVDYVALNAKLEADAAHS